MDKILSDILMGLSDKQAEVVIAAIGFISAAVVALFGLFGSIFAVMLNKRAERKTELRKIKENQYIDFLGSIAKLKVVEGNKSEDIKECLSERIQTIYLVGNREVQESLAEFLSILSPGHNGSGNQDELYAKLIKAMKKDLYGNNKKSVESIKFVVFKE